MIEKFTYKNGLVVKIGDNVEYKRLFRRKKRGVVVYLYDSTRPSPPWGENDVGFGVTLDDGSYLFCADTKGLSFISRKSPENSGGAHPKPSCNNKRRL